MNIQKIKELVKNFNFSDIFNQLGWDEFSQEINIVSENENFILKPVAQKKGFFVYSCILDSKEHNYQKRKKIETELSKINYEHIIIFYNSEKTEQFWHWTKRDRNKPIATREFKYFKQQEPDVITQKLNELKIFFDEEENLAVADVVNRTKKAFDVEKVTKAFYDSFKKEHDIFQSFIKNIPDEFDKQWYTSLMLNRLMFVYFIQKKNFLDKNINYLQDKLNQVKTLLGDGKFHSFYKSFLIKLFHFGLGDSNRTPELEKLFGKIPYLNGGLFDVHQIEKKYPDIDIPDEAFKKLFAFFDKYEWHLDVRQQAKGNEINPDVIGYIFEKYINDRAAMGAYYTKEDITEYISKNCIIPFIFDETIRNYNSDAFNNAFEQLKDNPNKYIYDAIRKGIPDNVLKSTEQIDDVLLFQDLPDDIKLGFNSELENKIVDGNEPFLFETRKNWNKAAPGDIALPTETFRELIERRKRYQEIRNKILNNEINTINDFITFNLDIRQFAQDSVDDAIDPLFIEKFYKAVKNITVLDPTCGSGAFLFAALNVLEPLYEACINKMKSFVENSKIITAQKGNDKGMKFNFFENEISNINSNHSNEKYFIYKSIILNNLYGVDMMNEAVEIAKLRLFLKLVACIEPDYKKENIGLEPLPDIDFNIKSGNTLVGFVNQEEIKKCGTKLEQAFWEKEISDINDQADLINQTFDAFKIAQKQYDSKRISELKQLLQKKLNDLNEKLNVYLAKQYGIDKETKYESFVKWGKNYKPFHWFSEFYEIIIKKGGFDVIIGNPPYVVYVASTAAYKLFDYKTLSCSNLYAYCVERSLNILNINGKFSMIVPNSSISADKLSPLQKLITNNRNTWISNYSWRPSKLFEGADMLLAIIISTSSLKAYIFTSMYYKWYTKYRDFLFDNIKFYDTTKFIIEGTIPKFSSFLFSSILEKQKVKSKNQTIQKAFLKSNSSQRFYYFRAVQYWFKILEKEPIYTEDDKQVTTGEMKSIYTDTEQKKYIFISILSSTTFFLHYITWSSCQVVNSRDFDFLFDIKTLDNTSAKQLDELGKTLQKDYQKNSHIITRNYSKKGRLFTMKKQHFYIKKSKPIIDEIDKLLAEHYCFTQGELDFIVNYDIKYRMGKED